MTPTENTGESVRESNTARQIAAFRDAAYGLLNTAREWKQMGRPDEVRRLVKSARWHMHMAMRIG